MPPIPQEPGTIVVGAGLAGLACASHLGALGRPVRVLEASDGVGGRVRTDDHNGYKLDRGFQVLLDAYPAARSVFDYQALDLKPFYPGADVFYQGKMRRVADPRKKPIDAVVSTISRGFGSPRDALRLLNYINDIKHAGPEHVWSREETTSAQRLRDIGLSEKLVERFLRPFLAGVFFDAAMQTSSRMMDFVLLMFASGRTCVPARGMGEMSAQLARLAESRGATISLNAACSSIQDTGVALGSGEQVAAHNIVLACDATSAHALLGAQGPPPAWRSTCTLWYAAERSPTKGTPILVLDGERSGPVNHLACMSDVSPGYAPAGRSLVCANTVGIPEGDDASLDHDARAQLRDWFGGRVDDWEPLRVDRVERALPAGTYETGEREEHVGEQRVLVCGDHARNPSIDGALRSGSITARRILDAS